MRTPTQPPDNPRPGLPASVRTVLERLARKDLRVRLARFPLLAAIVLPLFWLAQALVDLALRLPWGTRLALLVASGGLVGWLLYRHVILPMRRRLNLRTAALLVERKFPQFRTSLISAVDFTTPGKVEPSARSLPLVRLLLVQVSRLVDRTEIIVGLVDTRPLRRLFLAALAVCTLIGGLMWYFQPGSLVLARRVFLSTEALPSRTQVEAVSGDFTLNTGSSVEVAARASGVIPRQGRLVATYADGREESVPVPLSPTEPGVFRVTLRNVLQPFRYHFVVGDGVSPPHEVTTRTLPSLAKVRFIYFPPSYTGRPQTDLPPGGLTLLAGSRLIIEGESTVPLRSAMLELKGLDQTIRMDNGNAVENLGHRLSTAESVLPDLRTRVEELRPAAQSAAAERDLKQKAEDEARRLMESTPEGDERRQRGREFERAANEHREARGFAESAAGHLERATRELENAERQAAELKKQLEAAQAAPPPDAAAATQQKRQLRAEIPIPDQGLNGLSMHLHSEEGLASENDPVYRVRITVDKAPVVEVTEPRTERKTVLPGDSVLIRFRARDDYRLEKVTLKYIVLRPDADGEAVPAEEGAIPIDFPAGAATMTGQHVWDLRTFLPPLTEGSAVNYWVEAADHFTLYSPGAGTSRKMSLAVVSPEDKKAEVLAELEKAAKEIERLSQRQHRINEKTDERLRR